MKIRGTSQVLNRLKRVSSQATLQTKSAVVRNTDQIYAEAVANVPVRDGYLRGSGNTNYSDNQLTGTVAFGGNAAPYAPYVEFGTGRGFGIPTYKYGLTQNRLMSFAGQFKTGGNKNNMPYRPYLFNSFDKQYSALFRSLNNFKK